MPNAKYDEDGFLKDIQKLENSTLRQMQIERVADLYSKHITKKVNNCIKSLDSENRKR